MGIGSWRQESGGNYNLNYNNVNVKFHSEAGDYLTKFQELENRRKEAERRRAGNVLNTELNNDLKLTSMQNQVDNERAKAVSADNKFMQNYNLNKTKLDNDSSYKNQMFNLNKSNADNKYSLDSFKAESDVAYKKDYLTEVTRHNKAMEAKTNGKAVRSIFSRATSKVVKNGVVDGSGRFTPSLVVPAFDTKKQIVVDKDTVTNYGDKEVIKATNALNNITVKRFDELTKDNALVTKYSTELQGRVQEALTIQDERQKNTVLRQIADEYYESHPDTSKAKGARRHRGNNNSSVIQEYRKQDNYQKLLTDIKGLEAAQKTVGHLYNTTYRDTVASKFKYGTKEIDVKTTVDERLNSLLSWKNKAISTNSGNYTDDDVLEVIGKIESNNNPNAVNPVTGITGKYQVSDANLRVLSKRLGKSVEFLKTNPDGQRMAATELMRENKQMLTGMGLPATPANLYKIHQLGQPAMSALKNGSYSKTVMNSIMMNIPKKVRKTLGISDMYGSDGRPTNKALKSLGMDKKQEIVSAWNDYYDGKVASALPNKSNIPRFTKETAKDFKTRVDYLTKLVTQRYEKEKTIRKDGKELAKVKRAEAKLAFQEEMKLYKAWMKANDGKQPTKKPSLDDFISAISTGKNYPKYKYKSSD